MTGRLDGKVALVTGAAQGIGAAITHRFAAEGARVLVTDADEEGIRQIAAELGAPARGHDVTSEAAWGQVAQWAVEMHDHVDVLVNNAGVFLAARLQDTTLDDFRRLQEVNQVGVFLGMRTIAPLMAQRGSGSPHAQCVEIDGSHGGMAVNPHVYRELERLLDRSEETPCSR